MENLVKRFLQRTSFHALTSIAFFAGLLSLKLNFVQPFLQFIITSLIISVALITFYTLFGFLDHLNSIISAFSIVSGLLLGLSIFTPFSVALIFLMITLINYFHKPYLSALSAHLADLISTLLILPDGEEANILIRFLIESSGIVPGLVVSKIFLIGVPLLYSYKYLGKTEEEVFLKLVFLLGVSMAFRNVAIWTV